MWEVVYKLSHFIEHSCVHSPVSLSQRVEMKKTPDSCKSILDQKTLREAPPPGSRLGLPSMHPVQLLYF
jgi:hypothetical protein